MSSRLRLAVLPALMTVLLAWPDAGSAQTAPVPERGRIAATFGIAVWPDVGDLRPFPGGSFDDAGAAVDLAFHWPLGRLGPASVLVGANIGVLFHGSNVRGIREGEDLQASALYLAPSLKFGFGAPGAQRIYLDAGAGYYGVTIDEQEDNCFFSCDIYEYYDDDALGAYLGISADWPLRAWSSGFILTASAQAHFVNFDEPVELDSNSALGGPIYTLQVGVAWRP
jgi:hypothetical protein